LNDSRTTASRIAMSNNFELLQLATLRLSQDGTIKERLVDAYEALAAVDQDDLPDAMRREFGTLCDALHREAPQVRETAVRASVRKMSVLEAREYAALVVRLFAAMARFDAARAAMAATRQPRAPAPVVQLPQPQKARTA
jgi:hypothetical protein